MPIKIRTPRGIRKRIAKRKGPRAASSIHLDKGGLRIEGERFPYFIGQDIEVDTFGKAGAILTVGIFTDRLTVDRVLPPRTTLIQRFN